MVLYPINKRLVLFLLFCFVFFPLSVVGLRRGLQRGAAAGEGVDPCGVTPVAREKRKHARPPAQSQEARIRPECHQKGQLSPPVIAKLPISGEATTGTPTRLSFCDTPDVKSARANLCRCRILLKRLSLEAEPI